MNRDKVKSIMRPSLSSNLPSSPTPKSSGGPVFSAKYLGSAILTNGKTGLGCLQYPLRELYSIYRSYGASMLQERRLIISLDGITMLYSEQGIEKFTHNDIGSIHDVQLLKFEQKRDKKFYGAFIPMFDRPDSSKYSNLYAPLNKSYLANIHLSHPPVICIIMRRSSGIQALECHVFISTVLDEAKLIVQRVKEVSEQYRLNLSQETKVFQYKPYLEKEEKTRLFSKNQATKSQTSITSKASSKSVFAKLKENFRSKSTKSKSSFINANDGLLIDSLNSSRPPSRPVTPQPLKQPSKTSLSTVKSINRSDNNVFYRSQSALSQINDTSSFYYHTDYDCESDFETKSCFDDTASQYSNHLKWNPIKRAPESFDGTARVLCNYTQQYQQKDSAYNTNSSNDDSDDLLRIEKRLNPSLVGGVKVFPTLSNREQNQVRRGLSDYKPKKTSDNEIIDLTNRFKASSSSISALPANARETYQEQTNYIYYFNNEHFGGY